MSGTENLVPEHLRAIRATVERTERELGDVRRRVGSIEQHLANLQSDVAIERPAWGDAEYWMRLQASYDLARERRKQEA